MDISILNRNLFVLITILYLWIENFLLSFGGGKKKKKKKTTYRIKQIAE